MRKHKPKCPEGEEFCLKCGLSYENEIHCIKNHKETKIGNQFCVCDVCREDFWAEGESK